MTSIVLNEDEKCFLTLHFHSRSF